MIRSLEEAAQLFSKVTTDDAQHVLWFYGESGYEPGSFTSKLLEAIALADPGNLARLSLAYPGEVSAMRFATEMPRGMEALREIARADPKEMAEAKPRMVEMFYNLAEQDRKLKEEE